jgi:hypothetical protein
MLLLALLHQLNQQFINNFGLDQCGVHIKTNQTSVSSKHIVLLKEISTSIVLEISIKLAVNKALFSILPDTDNCTQERGYSSLTTIEALLVNLFVNQYSNVGRTLFLVTAAICLAANVSPRMLMIYRCLIVFYQLS